MTRRLPWPSLLAYAALLFGTPLALHLWARLAL